MERVHISIHRLTDKENVLHTYSGMLFNSYKKNENPTVCYHIGEPGGH